MINKKNKINFIMNNRENLKIKLTAVIIFLIAVVAFIPLVNANINTSPDFSGTVLTDSTDTNSTNAKIYTCPMHPDVISDKPGQCPKCGMDLELKSEKSGQDDTKKDTHNHKSHKGCKGH